MITEQECELGSSAASILMKNFREIEVQLSAAANYGRGSRATLHSITFIEKARTLHKVFRRMGRKWTGLEQSVAKTADCFKGGVGYWTKKFPKSLFFKLWC